MLTLSRKTQERIVYDVPPSDKPTRIEVLVDKIAGNSVRLASLAPRSVAIFRAELLRRDPEPDVDPTDDTDVIQGEDDGE